MHDMDRAATLRFLYQRLNDSRVRECLKAVAPDGSHPIAVALRDDPVSTLFDHTRASGWSCNIVVPMLKGVWILAMDTCDAASWKAATPDSTVAKIRTDCTIGVFLERLSADHGVDQNTAYVFELQRPGHHVERGRAELVGVADD